MQGGGKQVASLSSEYYYEARMWLEERYKAPKHAVQKAVKFMDAAQEGTPMPCDVCGLPLLLLLVMPMCGHLVCPDCAAGDSPEGELTCCPVCDDVLPSVSYPKCEKCDDVHCSHGGKKVVVDAHPLDGFAYLQPGFDLQWAETLREAEARALADSYERQRKEERETILSGSRGGGGGSSSAVPSASTTVYGGHTKAEHIIQSIAELRRIERTANELVASGRPFPPGYDGRPVRVAIYSESRKALDALGHFLYLRFGDDAIAQFWGKWRTSELEKFKHNRVRHWHCKQCPPRHTPGYEAGREVEFPETRCYGKQLTIVISAEHAPNGYPMAEGATSFQVTVNEEDCRRPGEVAWRLARIGASAIPSRQESDRQSTVGSARG